MKTINSHSRKDQIVINLPTDEYATAYFKIIDKKLEDSYIFHRKKEGNRFTFKGSICRFVWNGWNVFNTISAGEIEFLEEDGKPFIRHRVYFTESLVIALIFNIIPLFTLIFEPKFSLIVFIAIWLFYTINYLITIFRFNTFISNTLIKVNLEHANLFIEDESGIG